MSIIRLSGRLTTDVETLHMSSSGERGEDNYDDIRSYVVENGPNNIVDGWTRRSKVRSVEGDGVKREFLRRSDQEHFVFSLVQYTGTVV